MIDIKITFPTTSKSSNFLNFIRASLKWIFFVALFACPVVNYLTGKSAWSVVVLWGMYVVYKTFISPDILEYTFLSQILRWSIYILIMLVLIGLFLAPGWLYFILPIVGFSSLSVSAIVFFSDSKRQKKQAMPFIWEIILSLVSFITIWALGYPLNWPLIVLGSLSTMLLIIYIAAFGSEFFYELGKRLHLNG